MANEKLKANTKYVVKRTIRNVKKTIRKGREKHILVYNNAKKYIKNNNIEVINIEKKDLISINLFGTVNDSFIKYDFNNIISSDINIVGFNKDINNFYSTKETNLRIFNFGGNKLGLITVNPKDSFKRELELVKTLVASSKILGSSFVIVYIYNMRDDDSWFNNRYINKVLGSLEADLITYTSNNKDVSTYTLKSYRTDKLTHSLESLGVFPYEEDKGSIVHIEINLSNTHEIREWYIPIRIENNKVSILNKNDDKEYISYLNTSFINLKPKEDLLTLKDILAILDLEVPSEYKYLENTRVNKVCGRTTELTGNDLFFLIEPFNDKNDKYVVSKKEKVESAKKSISQGALFVISYMKLDKSIPHVVIDDVRSAHVKVCSFLHKRNNVKTIAITGSVGKTTTKDMLYSVLSEKYNVSKSERNANVQVKMGINLQNITPINDVYIQEVGGGRPGGASRHSKMINPDITMITNIGSAHLGNFKDQKDLMNNKLGIMDGSSKDGVFYLNIDDENLKDAKIDRKYYTYSISKSEADYYASDIEEKGTTIDFVINKKSTKDKIKAHINVAGLHNVLNSVVCFAIADNMGLTYEQIVRGLSKFETSGIRQNLITIANQKFLVDCYNSSLDSVLGSMASLDKMEVKNGGRKIAIIGDVTGAGAETESIHHTIANHLKDYDFDMIILYGNFAKIISDDLDKVNKDHLYFKANEGKKVEKILFNELNKDDIVLLKGSSKVLLEYILDLMYGTSLSQIRFDDGIKFVGIPLGSMLYRFYYKYALLYLYKGRKKIVKPLNTLFFKKVRGISYECFEGNKYIEKIVLKSNHVHIGDAAFKDAINLKEVVFKNVLFIGAYAFKNCRSLKSVKLNEGLLHISKNAFADCNNLESIYLPKSIRQIEEDAFKNCKKLTIHTVKDSYAYKYAKERNIKVECE